MTYIGDFILGSTFDKKFTTIDAGIPATLSGSPAISAYADNSTTEITAGITLSTDFDSRTGLNNVRVVASSGNGYAAGSNYDLVITTGTIGSKSAVGYVIASFSIEARPVKLNAGQIVVKKNTALSNFSFLMRDSSDHITPKTGLTITATRSIDGAAFGSCANSASELSNGVYLINLAAGDLNGNVITLKFTATGADQRTITILTQP